MERKDFLRNLGFLGMGAVAIPILKACSTDDNSGNNNGSCDVTPSETAGPFPTHDPENFLMADIRGDRTGITLQVNITVQKSGAVPLQGALVDIWHCDKDGNYSEYGTLTSNHFLRGRQATTAAGFVSFTTIFPGWYNGRATHIHVHIYTAAGNSLLVTQIAFPEGSDSAVALVNASTENGYTKGMNGYTYNSSDGIFGDDDAACQIASVTGSVAGGYVLGSIIKVPS